MASFRQPEVHLLLLRLFDNGSDTHGNLFYKDINGSVRYVFTQEPPSGKRLLSGQHNLRLCRFGEAYESYCRHKDGFAKESACLFGIVTIIGSEIPVFCIEKDRFEKCIIVCDKIENNSKGPGKAEEIPRAYGFLLSSIYRAFEENRIVRLTIMNCDKGIKSQFEDGKKYGAGSVFQG